MIEGRFQSSLEPAFFCVYTPWIFPKSPNTGNWSRNSRNGNKHQVVPTLFLFLLLERNALEITWRRRNLCVVTQERLRRHVVKSTSWRIFGKIDKVSYQILYKFTAHLIRTRKSFFVKKSQSIIFSTKIRHKHLIYNNIEEWYFSVYFTESIIEVS